MSVLSGLLALVRDILRLAERRPPQPPKVRPIEIIPSIDVSLDEDTPVDNPRSRRPPR